MNCIHKTTAGVKQIVQGIQLAKSYIDNVESLTKEYPAVSPTSLLDANKLLLVRATAMKVYRSISLEDKGSQAILSEIAGSDNCEPTVRDRQSVKRKQDGETDCGSLEQEAQEERKKHKKQKDQEHEHKKGKKKKSRDSSHTINSGSSSDEENIDVTT